MYIYGLGLLAEETGTDFKVYHFDYRGSTVALTDSNGVVTDRFTYDTYGKLIEHTGNSDVIFLYNGRDGVVSDTNGLYYMRARYYNPAMRRFINADILAGSLDNFVTLNRYAYANANPVMCVDPRGLSAERGVATKQRTAFNDIVLSDFDKIIARWELRNLCNDQYSLINSIEPIHMIADKRIDYSFEMIDRYRDEIIAAGNKYDIPPEIIASIILKEQYTKSIPDSVANFLTRHINTRHSTGLGAIFAKTARKSWEFTDQDVYMTLPSNDAELQYKLSEDNEFNINTIAAVLSFERHNYFNDPFKYDNFEDYIVMELSGEAVIDVDWHNVLNRYNGDEIYADKVYEYLPYMKEYLAYE